MPTPNEGYKFPDELPTSDIPGVEDEFSVEIIDDTPEEDRNRTPMPKPIVDELEKDELAEYGEKAQERLKQMRKVWHDERREKEKALREQNEAVSLAKRLHQENERMRGMINTGEKEYIGAIQYSASMELEKAKRDYKEAYDAGDTDKIIEAQQAMNYAQGRLMQAKNFKLPPLQAQETNVQQQIQQQPVSEPEPDHKAVEWQKQNAWFGPNKEMTAAALGKHESLIDEGVPVGSDEYYTALDKTMRRRFPEAFQNAPKDTTTPKKGTVVAPATRSTSSNKVRLSQSQVSIAKRLGLTPEQYAKAQLQLEKQNG